MIYLWDIDGTLLLSGGAGSRALDRVFRERYGVDRVMETISCAGKTDPLIVGEMFRIGLGRDPEGGEIDELIAAYEEQLAAELTRSERFRLMPAVLETLREIGGLIGRGMGIATGNTANGARHKLARAGLAERFHFGGYGCDSADRGELVAAAIERGRASVGREVALSEVVVVGDTTRDIEAARACGARVVAVATGSHDRETLSAAGPDVVIDTLAELPAWHRAEFG